MASVLSKYKKADTPIADMVATPTTPEPPATPEPPTTPAPKKLTEKVHHETKEEFVK